MNRTPNVLNPFEVLGVDASASETDIKKAYFQQVRQFTPEKHAEQFKQIREAYDLLKDPSRLLEIQVFSFTRPATDTVQAEEHVLLPPNPLEAQDLLGWIKHHLTDLERTDFTSDFNEVV